MSCLDNVLSPFLLAVLFAEMGIERKGKTSIVYRTVDCALGFANFIQSLRLAT